MTTDDPTRARWTTRAATTVDLLGAAATGVVSGVLLVDWVDHSRVDHPELYGFEIGMSFAFGALCGLLAVSLLVAAWRRNAHTFGFAAAGWVLACLPVSALLASVLPGGETPVRLLVAVLVLGVGSNVLAARAARRTRAAVDAPADA